MKFLRVIGAALLLASSGAYAAEQVVTSTPASQVAAPSTAVSFNAVYTSQNPQDETTSGLGLRIHYDSSQLTFVSVTNIFASGAQPVSEQADAGNEDGDAATDRVVLISWIDVGANWPGDGNEPVSPLFTANFTTTAAFAGTTLNYSASSTAAGYTLQAAPVQIGLATTVPDVVGQTQANATAAITGAGLAVGAVTTQGSAVVAAGSVISQSPAAGASVAGGSNVDLVVSSGPIVVPDVVGNSQAAATATLTAAGLNVTTTSVPSEAPVGTVVSQNPAAGSNASAGDTVALAIAAPVGAGGSATGVPTLSEWALVLLAMLVGLVAWVRHNKEA